MIPQPENGLATDGAIACVSAACERRARTEQGPSHSDDDGRRLMSAFCIHHDGRRYRYNGYRYDRLADAVAYAEAMQTRQSMEIGPDPFSPEDTVAPPTTSDSEIMAAWRISLTAGVYVYREFKYARLVDAVNYARLHDARMRQVVRGK